jgi:subtilisin family serine protease
MRNRILVLASLSCTSAYAGTVHLRNATFDPLVAQPQVEARLRAKQTDGEAFYLASFAGTRSSANRSRLQSLTGARFVGYVPDNTFVVEATRAEVEALAAHATWVGRFEPAYKLSNEIGVRPLRGDVRRFERAMGQARLTVTLFDGADPDEAIRIGSTSGFDLLGSGMVGPRWVLEFRGPISAVEALAYVEQIGYVEESADRTFRNDATRWVVQSNEMNVNSIWDRGLHGEGQIAGLIDGGIWRGHDMFRDPVNNTPGPNHRKLVYYNSSYGYNSSDAHGTHTGNTMAGNQHPITGSTFRNGIAYGAKIAFTELDDVWGGGLYQALLAQHNAGARVHSNSWGDDGTTQYTSDCQQIDQYSWEQESGMVAFAVTNMSTLKTPENAKSVLAVGATNQAPGQETIGSGGRGPTIDGRRKPEIFAPGISIISARNGTANQWRTMSGTSMACPAVTGAAALVRQYVAAGFLSGGSTSRVNASGALVRAILMNSSVDMAGSAGYPSNDEGWGRLLLANGLPFAGGARKSIGLDLRNANGLQPGQSTETALTVVNSSTPLRITMSFTDYPAQVFAANAAVNDVDLEVIGPGSIIYKGNVMSGGQSVTGGAADPKNSTEMVILNQPPTGVYRVRAIVRTVNQGGAQGMALFANGAIRADIPR